MQINDAFKYAKQKLDSSNYRRIDSEILLCSILNCNRTKLYANPDKLLSFDDKKKYKERIKSSHKKGDINDAVICGTAYLGDHQVQICSFEFNFHS